MMRTSVLSDRGGAGALPSLAIAACLLMSAVSVAPAQAVTLEHVKTRGFLICGVNGELPGFSERGDDGVWRGLDVDICRAVAAALFGEPGNVRFVPLSAQERFEALADGRIDVLSRNTTWTLSRDAGLEFAAVAFYDGQAFMVPSGLGVEQLSDLDGAAICVTAGTTTETNLEDHFHANDMTFAANTYVRFSEALEAYVSGACDALTADQSALHALRSRLEDSEAHVILPEVISREPLGPVVCQSRCQGAFDDGLESVVRWSIFVMLEAESVGLTSANAETLRFTSQNRSVQRLLGVGGALGDKLGLPNDWAFNVIRQVGNYAEIFDRNLGPDTPLDIPRGLNALWKNGGIHYPMPFL